MSVPLQTDQDSSADDDSHSRTEPSTRHFSNDLTAGSKLQVLLTYVADLELEVDRLRKQSAFVVQGAREAIHDIHQLFSTATQDANGGPTQAKISQIVREFTELLADVREPPGYHPAHDQVVAVALRPLVEQEFRRQQRLWSAPQVALQLDLESDSLEWFPARLRHILENLLSNALRFRDPEKTESWVRLELRVSPQTYEFRISDNGLGIPDDEREGMFEMFYRAGPTRAAGLGVGLAVVKLLVEQGGGSFTIDSGEGAGTTALVVLPRYDVADFLS